MNLIPDPNIPKTEAELANWMKANCYNFNGYAINGNSIDEGCGIEISGGNYIWYYTERGQKNVLKYFLTEEEVIRYAYLQIKNDKWAQTHCIGFTFNKSRSLELSNKLQEIGITFHQDEIPYLGPQTPAFRTFVFGCDVKKAAALKAEYYEK